MSGAHWANSRCQASSVDSGTTTRKGLTKQEISLMMYYFQSGSSFKNNYWQEVQKYLFIWNHSLITGSFVVKKGQNPDTYKNFTIREHWSQAVPSFWADVGKN